MIEEALYTLLTGVTARVYPNVIPAEGGAMPAVVYQRIDTPRIRTLDGTTDLAYPRFQITSWASSYSAVKTLAAAVRTALTDYAATVGADVIDDVYLEDEGDMAELAPEAQARRAFGIRQDFIIWHRE